MTVFAHAIFLASPPAAAIPLASTSFIRKRRARRSVTRQIEETA
jgi:hypothetical protein